MAPVRGEIKGKSFFFSFFATPFDVIHDRGLLTAAEQPCCTLILTKTFLVAFLLFFKYLEG